MLLYHHLNGISIRLVPYLPSSQTMADGLDIRSLDEALTTCLVALSRRLWLLVFVTVCPCADSRTERELCVQRALSFLIAPLSVMAIA